MSTTRSGRCGTCFYLPVFARLLFERLYITLHGTALYLQRARNACTVMQVGERYKLVKLLGSGSFSSVCSALDSLTGEQARPKQRVCICHSTRVTPGSPSGHS